MAPSYFDVYSPSKHSSTTLTPSKSITPAKPPSNVELHSLNRSSRTSTNVTKGKEEEEVRSQLYGGEESWSSGSIGSMKEMTSRCLEGDSRLNPLSTRLPSSRIKSIDEIVRQHSASNGPAIKRSSTSIFTSNPTSSIKNSEPIYDSDHSESSVDSLADELKQSLKFLSTLSPPSQPSSSADFYASSMIRSPSSSDSFSSSFRPLPSVPVGELPYEPPSLQTHRSAPTLTPTQSTYSLSTSSSNKDLASELALLLKSPRLTRIITLRNFPNQGLEVSLADLGSAEGHPVLIFLGLGCVRFLIGLYDELAIALNLRLIVLDRWGLGFTSEIEDEARGFTEWSNVVSEVMETLEINSYSILAHSAGSPYALASALRNSSKVKGRIHLLAPWVLTDEVESLVGSYKLLKYVPSAILRNVQKAEWKVQEWKLGKPPTLTLDSTAVGIGYDLPSSASTTTVTEDSPNYLSTPSSTLTRSPSLPVFFTRSSSSRHLSTPSPPSSSPIRNTLSSDDNQPLPSSFSSSSSLSSLSSSYYTAALLQASHSESLGGTASDLGFLLTRMNSSFDYKSIETGVKVWIGERDEKITMESIRWMERELTECEVVCVNNGKHNLMTNSKVMIEVLESIAEDWRSL